MFKKKSYFEVGFLFYSVNLSFNIELILLIYLLKSCTQNTILELIILFNWIDLN